MNLLLGVGVLAASIMFTWAVSKTRSSTPNRVEDESVPGRFAPLLTMLLTVGTGLLIAGLDNVGTEFREFWLVGPVAIVAIAGSGYWMTQRIRRRAAEGAPVAGAADVSTGGSTAGAV